MTSQERQLCSGNESYRNSVRERQLWSGNDGFVTWRSPSYVHSLTFNCSRILIVCRLTLFCIHIGHGQGWGAATTQTTYCQTVYFLTLINFQTHNCLLLNFLLIGIVSRCFEIGLFKAVKIADQVGSKYLGQRSVIVHFRNGRTTALKWRTSRMHRIEIMDFKDQNVSNFFYQKYIFVRKIHDFYSMHM